MTVKRFLPLVLATLVGAASLAAAVPANAQPYRGDWRHHGWVHHDRGDWRWHHRHYWHHRHGLARVLGY